VAALAFLAAGGLEAGVRALATPVDPAQLGLELSAAVELALGLTARAVGFAAPVMLAAVVANAALAVLSRAVPALNVFAVSLAAVLVGGGLILMATVPTTAAALDAIAGDAVAILAGRGGR
jgi:flagellar biosynthesis protein FliR